MIDWMEQSNHPFTLSTEASINLSDDPVLMDLMARAGFNCVFVGIESPNDASLKECRKLHNRNRDLVGSVNTIQRAGLEVQGGFIVGFDNDPASIFEKLAEFIQQSGIITAMVGLLNTPRGTRLYKRLMNEGRLLHAFSGNNTDCSINFTPCDEHGGTAQRVQEPCSTSVHPEAVLCTRQTVPARLQTAEAGAAPYRSCAHQGTVEVHRSPRRCRTGAVSILETVFLVVVPPAGSLPARHNVCHLRLPFQESVCGTCLKPTARVLLYETVGRRGVYSAFKTEVSSAIRAPQRKYQLSIHNSQLIIAFSKIHLIPHLEELPALFESLAYLIRARDTHCCRQRTHIATVCSRVRVCGSCLFAQTSGSRVCPYTRTSSFTRTIVCRDIGIAEMVHGNVPCKPSHE